MKKRFMVILLAQSILLVLFFGISVIWKMRADAEFKNSEEQLRIAEEQRSIAVRLQAELAACKGIHGSQ